MKKNLPASSFEAIPFSEPSGIIVIVASDGGLQALNELVSQFENDWKASVFVVLHLSHKSIGDYLVHRLQQNTASNCKMPTEGEFIATNTIYIAPPDRHLLVKKGSIVFGTGPQENRWRPSIDVLFRSAAAAYGSPATGIILTGLLDDGTSGMSAIKRSGGTCMVQDPNKAEFPDMPLSVLNNMQVDYCNSLSEMGSIIEEILLRKSPGIETIPPEVTAEAEISARVSIGIENLRDLLSGSVFACPDCGGGLWKMKDDTLNRYRCHIGHAYSEQDLMVKQAEAQEATLWVALRMMEERRHMMVKIIDESKQKGLKQMATIYEKKEGDLSSHIERLKELLFATQKI